MENLSPLPPSVIRFGVFEADVRAGELRKSGTRVRMQEQPFQILLMLLERPAEVVTREEIRQKLWAGDVFVDYAHGVNSAVARLRDALGDSADNPRYIETLPRRGYRFIAPVDVLSPVQGRARAPNGNGNGTATSHETPAVEAATAESEPSQLPRGADVSLRRRWIVSLSVMAAIASAILIAAYVHPVPKLKETDSIVLADFANSTSDPIFDSTLRQALAVKLGESPFLSIVAEQRMRDILRFMGRSPDERITSSTAREICQRLGNNASLSGQISQLGDHYYILLEAFSCATGDSIGRAGAEAVSKADTLKALDAAAAEIRRKLGESLGSIQKYDVPIEQATTTSLEALKAFSLGQAERNRGNELASIPFLQRAIELDPNFAMAYAVLGQVYANRDESALAMGLSRKAFERRERAGDQERFYISTHYYDNVTRELDKSIQTYELWQQTYPRDVVPRINLSNYYQQRGECEKARAESLGAERLEPNRANVYEGLIDAYLCLDRLADAKATYSRSAAHGFNGMGIQLKRYIIAFYERDFGAMEQLRAASAGQSDEDTFLGLAAGTAAYFGRLGSAEELSRRAVEVAQRENRKESAAVWRALRALTEAEYGRNEQARRLAAEQQATVTSHDAETLAALTLARSGDATRAETITASLGRQYPSDTLLHVLWIPAIHAQIELTRGNAASALQFLESAEPYELGETEALPPMFSAFLRGEAYLQIHDGKSAAAEFQKVVGHPGIVGPSFHGALARLDLARALAIGGDVAGSRKAYQDFLALWKDADPNTRIIKQAKLEYSQLH